MILFAYAGNMNVDEFAKLVPSAKKIGVAKLPAYNFIFNTTAPDESSKANVVKSLEPAAVVWGILIEIDDNERDHFFNPDPVTNDLKLEPVNCLTHDGTTYHAEVFTAKPHAVNTHLLPYDWYHARIIKLAKDAELPVAYIRQIAAMAFKTDPDEERRARRMKKFGL
ncbi:hypothetical protein SAMN05216490_1137 [Mucilaginibacter mallensis]|uniref:AIG2-like family protein n=1 Tax=Mucilaginibacter mallensis TaxID=652787 RepID=A0A1H1S4M4_MUCMA|nr:gamma-glutamylcyclotransferase family protein [Mucilaginibacter mallensis]SDS42904.1 hypothetical protein SAMN05216490_1137 [Mucilaginibacter mallensis]